MKFNNHSLEKILLYNFGFFAPNQNISGIISCKMLSHSSGLSMCYFTTKADR